MSCLIALPTEIQQVFRKVLQPNGLRLEKDVAFPAPGFVGNAAGCQRFGDKLAHLSAALTRAQAVMEIAGGGRVLEHIKKLSAKTLSILKEAEKERDHPLALRAIREARANEELNAGLLGQLDGPKEPVKLQHLHPKLNECTRRFLKAHGRLPTERECKELGIEDTEQSLTLK